MNTDSVKLYRDFEIFPIKLVALLNDRSLKVAFRMDHTVNPWAAHLWGYACSEEQAHQMIDAVYASGRSWEDIYYNNHGR